MLNPYAQSQFWKGRLVLVAAAAAMTRRCSHCNSNGHNSRTCPARGGVGGGGGGGGSGSVKLFGVRLTDGSIIKKSASMGNLSLAHYHSSSSPAASPNPGSPSSEPPQDPIHVPDGYLSDDPVHASYSTNRRSERKKGVPWTEEEHRLFLLGLQKLGKGDWRGISRNYVISRTPTQVASHAQKYFIRQVNATRRKRRSSLFDMVPDVVTDPPPPQEEQFMLPPQADEAGGEGTELPTSQPLKTDKANSLPSLDLYLKPDFDPMETSPHEVIDETKEIGTPTDDILPVTSSFFPAFFPIPFPMWPSNVALLEEDRVADFSHHQVLKPIPVLPKEPVNVDELVGMSQLSLGETGTGHKEPSPLSLKLLGEPSARLSAFHARRPANVPDINKGSSSHAFQSMRQI